MAPPAAALAATTALLAATFPGCSTTVHQTVTPCIRAKVGGKVVCLAPGKRCAARYEHVYRSYGLTCRNALLRERNFVAPPNP
jgi:hypothetical protein